MIPEKLLALRGDPARGRDLFRSATHISCRNCHIINNEGKELGPNLSQIGKKYPRDKILEQILDPSRSIDQQYLTHIVETKQGQVHSGLLIRKTPTEIVLKDPQGTSLTIPQGEVEQVTTQRTSLMPQDLLRDLTPQEAADLLEFLTGRK
ncbi:MAG: c-type cytochrome [Planctomycetales bacterium]